MMFPMLNKLQLVFYVCFFVQLMYFLSVISFFIDYAIGLDSRSIVQNCTSHEIRSPA